MQFIDSRDPANQLNISKTHVENKLKDLLVEMKRFKFIMMLQVIFCKKIENGETKYSPQISFNS